MYGRSSLSLDLRSEVCREACDLRIEVGAASDDFVSCFNFAMSTVESSELSSGDILGFRLVIWLLVVHAHGAL